MKFLKTVTHSSSDKTCIHRNDAYPKSSHLVSTQKQSHSIYVAQKFEKEKPWQTEHTQDYDKQNFDRLMVCMFSFRKKG